MRLWLLLYIFYLQIVCIGAIQDRFEVEIDALLSEETNYDDILELSDAGFADDEMDEDENGEEHDETSMESDPMDDGTPPPMIAHLPIEGEEPTAPVSLVELLSTDESSDSTPVQKYDGYGECTDVFVKGKKRIKLFVYIDICPDRTQCDVIRDWSTTLVEYILSKYSVHCNVQFILAKGCKSKFLHPFRDALLLEDEYYGAFDDEEKKKKADKLFPDLPYDTRDYNFAINFFRGGRGKAVYAKHIIDVEKKSHISHIFNFYMCRKERGCLPKKHSLGKDRWLKSLANVVAYSRLRIVGTFVCDTVSRAVPIEFYVGKKHKCICRCPAGYERRPVNGKPCCVKKVKKCKCAWIKKCFKYRIREEWNNKVCRLRNWYDIKAITPIPLPVDNYVGFGKNKYDKSIAKNGPRIELQVGDTTTSYTWRYFQRNRKDIFNNIELFSVGRYKIILRAFDYGPKPVVCWTWLAVTDENRPSSKKPCPEEDVFGKGEKNAKVAVYSKKNFEKAIAIAKSFKKWIIHRQNDRCTADWNVDPECLKRKNRYIRWTFNADRPSKKVLATFDAPKKCFRVFKDDTDWMTAHVDKQLITSEIVGRAKYCKKCCKLYHQFSEWYIPFKCKKKIPGKECCPGEKCDLKQCLQGSGRTFFEANVQIKEKWKRKTEEIIQHLSDNGYNSDNEIHFELPESCKAYGNGAPATIKSLAPPPSCQIEKKVKALFDEKRKYISKYFKQEIFNNFNVNKLIKWRYKIDDGAWTNYHTQGPEIFKKLKTEIILEAWSACGRICRFVFHVYVHLHADIDVCEAFAEDSFYQSTRYHTQGTDDRFCNHPESDFGELTFDFNPAAKFEDFGAKHHLKYTFVTMKCWAKFGRKGSYTSRVNVADWSKSQRFLKRYAIVLAERPTTREDTPVHWECKFLYKNYKGQKRSASCEHDFTYCDCEGPGWDCAWGECQKKCTNPKEKRPNQACGGTQLIWNQKANKAVRDDKLHDCCQDCGKGAVCASVFPGVYDNTICSCRVVGKDPNVLPGKKPFLNTMPYPEPYGPPKMYLKVFSATSDVKQHPTASVTVDAGYKIISGGAKVDFNSCSGQLLVASYPQSATTWFAKSKDHVKVCQGTVTAFAVGLYDPNDEWDVKIVSVQSPTAATFVTSTAKLPSGYTLTGGGALDDNPGAGHLLYESSPTASGNGWIASGRTVFFDTIKSKVTAYAIGIQYKDIPGSLKCTVDSTTSGKANHPVASLTAASDAVVIGGGGSISQSPNGHGNVLTGIYIEDLSNSFSASGKDHEVADLQKATAFAISCPLAVACFDEPPTAVVDLEEQTTNYAAAAALAVGVVALVMYHQQRRPSDANVYRKM